MYYVPNLYNFYAFLHRNSTNPSICTKHVECDYFPLLSKFKKILGIISHNPDSSTQISKLEQMVQ